MYRTPVPSARQGGYDQIPAFVQQRADLTSGAKRLYGLLQSIHRLKWERDYRWMAAELAASVRSIVRWVKQLVAARLIEVTRRGQGLANVFKVLALVTSGRASLPASGVTQRQPRPDASSNKKKERDRKNRGTARSGVGARDYIETREGLLFRDSTGRMRLIPRP